MPRCDYMQMRSKNSHLFKNQFLNIVKREGTHFRTHNYSPSTPNLSRFGQCPRGKKRPHIELTLIVFQLASWVSDPRCEFHFLYFPKIPNDCGFERGIKNDSYSLMSPPYLLLRSTGFGHKKFTIQHLIHNSCKKKLQ